MPSLARREAAERALRAASLLLAAFCAWALMQGEAVPGRRDAGGAELSSSLRAWTRQRPADTLRLLLRAAPAPWQRDWLRALADAGTASAWSGAVPATALEVVPLADPAGGVRVLAAAPAAGWVRLADSLGVLDSARALRGGAAFTLAAAQGALTMEAGGQTARAAVPAPPAARHAVVLARAGWEARFVIAALEERGWSVAARLEVAPGIAVTQGRPLPLDTARQAVAVALDSLAAPDAAALQRFALNGGGVVLGPAAARTAPLLAAGGVGPHRAPPTVTFSAAAPRRALGLDPVLPGAGAVVLERQGPHAVLAARRTGSGRVVQTGYEETWRWRMANVADAVDGHRRWWTEVVAAAAYRGSGVEGLDPSRTSVARYVDDPAPLASLVAALGTARAVSAEPARALDARRLLPVAAMLLFACLLVEIGSRRLRGAA